MLYHRLCQLAKGAHPFRSASFGTHIASQRAVLTCDDAELPDSELLTLRHQ